jgi:hypothetical protein
MSLGTQGQELGALDWASIHVEALEQVLERAQKVLRTLT